jgi:hypothetical protein
VNALAHLLEGLEHAENVERAVDLIATAATTRRLPLSLTVRMLADHAYIELTTARGQDRPTPAVGGYAASLLALAEVATEWGHSALRTEDVWWARIGGAR